MNPARPGFRRADTVADLAIHYSSGNFFRAVPASCHRKVSGDSFLALANKIGLSEDASEDE